MPIVEKICGVDIRGVDISENYVRLYGENTNRLAFIGTIENLPVELGTFDYIICITVLMYLDHGNLGKAASNLILPFHPWVNATDVKWIANRVKEVIEKAHE
jgi:hypothetical protein